MNLLKQSTAFTFPIGPFLDDTDGKTAETGLTIAQSDIQISKAGGAFAQTSAASPTTTHDADGWYQCPLTATDTNTLGRLTVQIAMAGAIPVWEHFMVVPANVYDALVAGSDKLDVNTAEVGGTAQTGHDVGGSVNTVAGRILGTIAAGTHNAQSGDAYARLGAPAGGVSTAADIAAVKSDTGTISTRVTTGIPNVAPGADGGLATTDGTKLNQTVTLANGAHGGAAATMTLKSVAVNNGDAGGIGVSVTGSGTGNSHALYLNSTNGQGLCVVAGSHAVTATSSAGKGMEIIGATGDIVADITGNLSGSIGSVGTGGIASTSYAAGAVDAAALAADASQEIADTTLARSLAAESYAADGAVPTLSQMLYGIWSALAQFDIAATTITCRKLDGTTSAMTFTLNDGTNPTSRTRAT